MINLIQRLSGAFSPLLLAGDYYFGPYGRKSDKNKETLNSQKKTL